MILMLFYACTRILTAYVLYRMVSEDITAYESRDIYGNTPSKHTVRRPMRNVIYLTGTNTPACIVYIRDIKLPLWAG